MTAEAQPTPKTRAWLRIARRELAGGIGGFWIYLLCLALGAWAIAAAGSITSSFSRGLELQSRALLGGDAHVQVSQREASQEERAWLDARGTVSAAAQVDLMARQVGKGGAGKAGGDKVRQIDVRGIDAAFPLVGSFTFGEGEPSLAEVLAKRNGVWGIAASQSLFNDFGLKTGDRLSLGEFEVEVRAVLKREPDRIGEPGLFEPRAIIALEALRETGQLSPGRLFRTAYRIVLKPDHLSTFEGEVKEELDSAGFRYRAPEDAVEGLGMLLDMLNTFMSVIGIAALVAGGVGVAQATSSFLESRIDSIAALKALGADSGTIRAAYALQLGVLAGLGALIGVALGAISPWLLKAITGDAIPLPTELSLYPEPLLKAFVLAMLAAVMFVAMPLGRARATPPAALFRREGGESMGKSPGFERGIAIAAAIALVIVATTGSVEPLMVVGLLLGAGAAWGVLVGVAYLLKGLAGRLAKTSRGYLRLALANLGGPGSLAPVVAPALGLGLSLMSLVAVVQTNLLGQLRDTAPANAPSVIFRQIPFDAGADFDALMQSFGAETSDSKQFQRAPFILGRVTKLKGKELVEDDVTPEERWVVRGETAMTVLARRPPEVNVRQGKWWPEDYSGPLLVSVEEGAAKGLGLRIGDRVGFRIYGRDVEGEVASIRKVDWGGFGPNMAFILSPGTMEAAKPFSTAIVIVAPDKEQDLVRAVADRWPGVLSFQLRRTLETAADLFGQVSLAVTALASVVTTAGVLVLFGAFAAAARKRRRESALLKVFGASRAGILGLYAFEFALAAFAAAFLGAMMGIVAAHPIVIFVFEATWRFDIFPVLAVAGIATLAAAAGGAAVGWATLSQFPARVLRSA